MSRSALDKPFQAISEKIKLRFTLTPRGMDRPEGCLSAAPGAVKGGCETDRLIDNPSEREKGFEPSTSTSWQEAEARFCS